MKYTFKLFALIGISILMLSCSKDELKPGIVRFSDIITDDSGNRLKGVEVVLWINDTRYSSTTDKRGKFIIDIEIGEFPSSGYIAMSIFENLFRPKTVTYLLPIQEGSYALGGNNRLESCPTCIQIDSERSHELWHLGDDSYGGAVNSQFQKNTDGTGINFQLGSSEDYQNIRVSFYAKGVQINGCSTNTRIISVSDLRARQQTLSPSNDDGSYSLQSFTFGNQPPVREISLISGDCSFPDFDDWEFTGLFVEGL